MTNYSSLSGKIDRRIKHCLKGIFQWNGSQKDAAEEAEIVVWVVYLTTIILSLCRLCKIGFLGRKDPFNFMKFIESFIILSALMLF